MAIDASSSNAAHTIAASDIERGSDVLFASLYEELRRLARREVWRNGARDIMGTDTLVHEVWLSMGQRPSLTFQQPAQFLAYAARTMRGIVIDRLRASQAQKRGGGLVIASLDEQQHERHLADPSTVSAVGEALDELAALEPALATIVDLIFFGGLTLEEVARIQGVSERTVRRQWQKARLLLHRATRD